MADDELDGLAHLVKPLQWWTPSSSNNWTHGAKTLFGTYYVGIDGGRHNAWIEIFREGEGIEQWIGPDRGDLHIAMGDARVDYTRRILSALNLDALRSSPADVGGYSGPIEPGMRFTWEPNDPHARCDLTVTRVVKRAPAETMVFSVEDGEREECWNDESRFREAVAALAETTKGDER